MQFVYWYHNGMVGQIHAHQQSLIAWQCTANTDSLQSYDPRWLGMIFEQSLSSARICPTIVCEPNCVVGSNHCFQDNGTYRNYRHLPSILVGMVQTFGWGMWCVCWSTSWCGQCHPPFLVIDCGLTSVPLHQSPTSSKCQFSQVFK